MNHPARPAGQAWCGSPSGVKPRVKPPAPLGDPDTQLFGCGQVQARNLSQFAVGNGAFPVKPVAYLDQHAGAC